MAEVNTLELVKYLDERLSLSLITDYPNALNGLQVENRGPVRRVGAAVDASERAIRAAVSSRCELLLVHHGLFWDGNRPVTDRRYRKLWLLLENDVALYSAHLPLDVHPELGNNAQLAAALGLELAGEFAPYHGVPVGRWGTIELKREVLVARLDEVLGGRVRVVAAGPEVVRRVGVLTGSGGEAIEDAVRARLDTLITGEGPHHTTVLAEEAGINVLFGGHYATETFGVRALAADLARRFDLEWEFLDLPTGT